MPTYVKVNGQVNGPFTDAEIRQRLAGGEFAAESPAWQMGMPEWTTVAALLPAQTPSVPPPLPPPAPPPLPPPVETAAAPADFHGSLAEVNATTDRFSRPFQPDAYEALAGMGGALLEQLDRRLGATARPNFTFFSHRVATVAIQRLRVDLLKGASLTPEGEVFVGQIAAYLGLVAIRNWTRRGLKVAGRVHFTPGAGDNELYFEASRERNGQREVYIHDFLRDTQELLLRPAQSFPYLKDQVYALDSLTMPSPEQLYLYGVCFMQSPSACHFGSWPSGPKPGGRPEDFEQSKELLVDDLHEDCGVPKDDPALRKLSLWLVFPPYGWHENETNDYNMMAVFSQVSHQRILPFERAVDYLRALLRCQSLDIRNLAARCLMVYRVPPQDPTEAEHYQQALQFPDAETAALSMAKYQHKLEGVEVTPPWLEQIKREREDWLLRMPPPLSWRTAAENDPEYAALAGQPADDILGGLRGLESLLHRYPEDWVLQVLYASLLMCSAEAPRGETALRQLIQDPPDCSEGHSRLGALLRHQGRLEEAMAVHEDEVARWPWNHRAVDSCLWLATEGMTCFPQGASHAA